MLKMNRTVRDFENALESLLKTHRFEKITVDQICEEALLHRSSFYRYFHDKYDLLEKLMSNRLGQLMEKANSEDQIIDRITNYMNDNKDIYRHLSGDNSSSTLHVEIMRILSDVILQQSKQKDVKSTILQQINQSQDPELEAYTFSGAIMGIYYWWQLHNYDVPINEVADFIKDYVFENIRQIDKGTK